MKKFHHGPRPALMPGQEIQATRDSEFESDEDMLAPLDVRRMLGILRRHRHLVALVSIVVAGFTVLYVARKAPLYQATAVIRLRDTRGFISGGLTGNEDEQLGGPMANPLLSLVELLSSRSMAGAVIDSMPLLRVRTDGLPISQVAAVEARSVEAPDTLSLVFTSAGTLLLGAPDSVPAPDGTPIGHPDFRVALASTPVSGAATVVLVPRDAAIGGLLGHLQVRPRENTDVVDVEYSNADPVMARTVANRLVETFQAVNAQGARAESHARRVFLEGQLREADSTLSAARQAVATFRASQRAYSAQDRFAAQQAAAASLQGRRAAAAEQRQLYLTLLRKAERSDAPSGEAVLALLSSPGLSDNPVIRQIAEQLSRYQSQYDSLTTGPYGSAPTNPDVTRLNTLIASTLQRLAAAVRSNVAVLDEQIRALDTQQQSAPSYERLSANESDETSLIEAVAASQRRGDELRQEYQAARLAEAVQVGQVEIVDLAGPPTPAGVSRKTILMLGFALALFAGCLAAFTFEFLKPTIWRQQDLAYALDSPNPIVVPRFGARGLLGAGRIRPVANGKGFADNLAMLSQPGSGGAEAVRALRTKLIFSGNHADLKTLLVTSAVEDEGKTTMAANLAVAFAQQGHRVLLVDADMRRAALHRVFGAARVPGLSDVLARNAEQADAARPTRVANLWLMPAGSSPSNPAETLGGPGLSGLLDRLGEQYDLVVLDSPPVLAVADAAIIAAIVDGVLIVVRAGRAQREAISTARDQLADVGAQVIGAVLNDPDGEISRAGNPYYFRGYGTDRR